jgi:hypothetical protein
MDDAGERVMTWAGLLTRWTEFARGAVALPDDGEGGRWKRAVPHVIGVHAVTMAMGELDLVEDAERAAALDRAELVCREAARALNEIWRGESLPPSVEELLGEARVAFEAAANAGVEWCVAAESAEFGGHEALVMRLVRGGFVGELFIAPAGVRLGRGCPCAFARGPGGSVPGAAACAAIEEFVQVKRGVAGEGVRTAMPRQVYRQMDFSTGRAVRDLVCAMNEPLPAGQPVLVLAIEGGRAAGPVGGVRVIGVVGEEVVPVEFSDGAREQGG